MNKSINLAVCAMVIMWRACVSAQSVWNGGGTDDNWTTAANWGGTAPVAYNTLTFAGSTRLNTVNDFAEDTSFNGITFDAAAGAFTLNGSRVMLRGDITFSANPAAAVTHTINHRIFLAGARRDIKAPANGTLIINGAIGGAQLLGRTDPGTVVLNGTNTFSTSMVLFNGTTSFSQDVNLGAVPASPDEDNLMLYNGILLATESLTINANRGIKITSDRYGPLYVETGKTVEYGGVISGTGNDFRTGSVTYQGTLRLTGTDSTFSGRAIVLNGVLEVASLANAGDNSSIGTGIGNPQINLGNSAGTGTLTHIGSSDSTTDRKVTIGGGTNPSHVGGATIINNGSGLLTFSSATFNEPLGTATAPRVLTLGGTNTGDNLIAGVIADNSASAAISLTKTDIGTWMLSGANTYTGATIINDGTLKLGNDNTLPDGGTLILNGGTLSLNGKTDSSGTLDITADSTLSLGIGTGCLTFTGDCTASAWIGDLALTGTLNYYAPGSVRFTHVNRLTPDQLARITYKGNSVRMDENGYLLKVMQGTMLLLY